jgi:hypothetical protein
LERGKENERGFHPLSLRTPLFRHGKLCITSITQAGDRSGVRRVHQPNANRTFNIFVGTGILLNCEDCATEIDKTVLILLENSSGAIERWNVDRSSVTVIIAV